MSNAKTGDRMKQSFFCLMEGITKALTVEPEDVSPTKTLGPQPTSEFFDRATVSNKSKYTRMVDSGNICASR